MHRIIDKRYLTDSTFLLRLERKKMVFNPGQYITVGLKDSIQHREYSIYSGEKDDYLDILIREIIEGDISLMLKTCAPGQYLEVNGPFGFMKLDKAKIITQKFVFIASGTGIAPFHSFVTSYPEMDYTLLHGVRYRDEAYDHADYDPERYVLCTSRESNGNYNGHVTTYLDEMEVDPAATFYVCGNSSMIYDVYQLLGKKGIPLENILSEVYF
jgi:ferredoxin--NADP+ reductase